MNGAGSVRPLAISVMYLFTLVVGLSFQTYIAYRYGASHAIDIFIFSSALVLFFTASFSSGLTGSFVPLFTEKQHRSAGLAWPFSIRTLIWTFGLTLTLAGILAASATPVLRLVTHGDGGQITAEDVLLLRWQAISIPFVVMSQLLILILNCLSKFIISTFSTLLNSGGILLLSYLFASFGISSLGIGIFSASAAQFAFLVALYMRELRRAKRDQAMAPSTSDNDFDLWSMFNRVGILAAMFMLFKGSDIFDRYLSLSLGSGYTSYIGYSYRILIAGGNLLSVGLLTTSYPEISKAVARRDLADVRAIISRTLRLLFVFLAPITFWIFGAGDIVISLLFQHGKFGSADAAMVFDTMKAQIGLLLFPALGSFFSNILYAYRQVRTVVYIGLFSTALNVGLKILLLKQFGYFGLVLSVTICYFLDTLILYRSAVLPIGGLSLARVSYKNASFLLFVAILTILSLIAGQFVNSALLRISLLLAATAAYAVVVFRSGLLPTALLVSGTQNIWKWAQPK